jgi:hypothetical protein
VLVTRVNLYDERAWYFLKTAKEPDREWKTRLKQRLALYY